mgnify:CR=1 FL=1
MIPSLQIGLGAAQGPDQVASTLQILGWLTVLALAPSIVMMLTSFTRIVLVLSFVRTGLATGQTPPNQVLIGLAIFLTLFTMAPVYTEAYQEAWQPYEAGTIDQAEALQRAEVPLRQFMLSQTREKDLALFVSMGDEPAPAKPEETPLVDLIPAFIISELKSAFEMGFVLYLPFVVIDLVVSSTLMSMGMLMLPPMMISLPFKLLLFVLVDGWHLIAQSLLASY